jgi:hypothetical protein
MPFMSPPIRSRGNSSTEKNGKDQHRLSRPVPHENTQRAHGEYLRLAIERSEKRQTEKETICEDQEVEV